MLHLTNGDSAAGSLRETGVPGTVVAWRDVLHEGPVPAALTLEAMSDVRARFLASCDFGKFDEIRRDFNARDDALRGARHVVLWFEHDLYDQLQLIQILATLARQRETKAELINIGEFPGVVPFYGLGQLTPAQLASLWGHRIPVTSAHTAVAVRAWAAFCSPDPSALKKLVETELPALPFLRAALQRHLEEFPAMPDGLGRTDRQILEAVASGHQRFVDVFRTTQGREAAPYMGDTSLQSRIDTLTKARHPLLTREPFTLTPDGRRVLAGEVDARMLNGIDRWFGGVHLRT